MKPIRVCFVSPLLFGGGAEYQMSLLIAVLRQQHNHELYYLAHSAKDTESLPGVTVVRIGRGGRAPRFGYVTEFFRLRDALARIAPQVIYQRVACGYTGICAWYARRHGARMIWHVASDADVMPEHLDAGRNVLRAWLEKRSIEYGLHNADRIVVQTQDQARLLEHHYGRRASRVVANFQESAQETVDKSGPLMVVWVANLKPLKQPEVFVRLAEALSDLPAVRFLMIGEAPTVGRQPEWLRALLEQIAASPNLEYRGGVSQAEVNALLARAHVFVNTSVREGFPNTFIQAWMRQAVVVSLQVDPDQVLNLEQLGICAGGEPALQAAVRQLLADPSRRQQYAQRGLAYATRVHNTGNADALVALIEACAGEVSPR